MLTNGSGNGRAPAINGGAYPRAIMSGEADEDTVRMLRQINSKLPPERSGEMLLQRDRHSRLAQIGLLP